MNFYKLTERSFINNRICEAGEVIQFNDDPTKGGSRPGRTWIRVNEAGEELASAPRSPRQPAAAAAGGADGGLG